MRPGQTIADVLKTSESAEAAAEAGPVHTRASEPRAEATTSDMLKAAPTTPPLERMHQVSAADPRAQAKFFLLKTQLHNKFILGLQQQHIGRQVLSSRPRARVLQQTVCELLFC